LAARKLTERRNARSSSSSREARFGVGYNLALLKETPCDEAALRALIRSHVADMEARTHRITHSRI
jgi:hypothetical protein